ncbi:MAG: tRNA (N(6)-L-threonylcarbamoyladenosine(37)-C(2))-methylthiotransferase MtaB [Pontiellaceae bacterium]|nr:tRNA (N(6)-L-threonylcarbamoyladenosine(37)-C(2))-methylthiotransferase MtaB [Pontiellaceae bacterium]
MKNDVKTYRVSVLGCKVNQYDAQQIELLLERCGLTKADSAAKADLMIIHTCGVTSAAAQKSRQTIRRMQRSNPLARIIVTGCAADNTLTQVDQAPLYRIPAGPDWLERLAECLETLDLPKAVECNIETDTFILSRFGDHTRAFLKVQDGCDIGCSYCIIPQLRKAPRDKTIENAVAEAEALTQSGYREIVVTGVSVGLYGRKIGTSLAELLRRLIDVPDIGRIRLSSLHPGELTDELLEVWASAPNMMPHLHLSLQSGSDTTLSAMRRGYTAAEYFDAVQRARASLNNPAFTTDVIVGFPGETDTHFSECYDFCRTVGFSKMHIFTYSPRPNTPASKMPNQIDGAIAAKRSDRLHQLGETLALEYHQSFLDKKINVLVEQIKNGTAVGYSEHYVPVQFSTANSLKKQIVSLRALHATAEGLKC